MAASHPDGGKTESPNSRFKVGNYLAPKVERIMLQIAQGTRPRRIAELYEVPESFVHYVARKTGFRADVFREHTQKSADSNEHAQ